MLIKEVESRLSDFFEAEVISVQTIIRNRFAGLINKQEIDYRKDLYLDKKDIIRQRNRICANPKCRSSNTKKNGYHESQSFIIKEIGISIKSGQFECKDCGLRWSVNINELHTFLEDVKKQIRNLAVEIKSINNSLIKTTELIETAVGKKYSHTSISRWYRSKTSILQEKVPENCSGYYSYDEQQVSAGGKKLQRLTLRDLKIKQPIAEQLAPNKSNESIQKFLVNSLKDKPKIALIVDGDTSYPAIITNDLKMQYQLDIGHLFENIRKAFKDECAYGLGHKKLHLIDELKKQELFDVFYPRPELISFVKNGLIKLDTITDEIQKEILDVEIQKELLKIKIERKKARRRKNHISEHKNYNLKDAQTKFEHIKTLCKYYPKSVQKLIVRIEKDWEHYILFLVDRNVPPTSNYIEQYYSSTLQRSEKKKFRNKEQLNEFIRIERIKKAGNFSEILNKTGLNFLGLIGVFIMAFLGI